MLRAAVIPVPFDAKAAAIVQRRSASPSHKHLKYLARPLNSARATTAASKMYAALTAQDRRHASVETAVASLQKVASTQPDGRFDLPSVTDMADRGLTALCEASLQRLAEMVEVELSSCRRRLEDASLAVRHAISQRFKVSTGQVRAHLRSKIQKTLASARADIKTHGALCTALGRVEDQPTEEGVRSGELPWAVGSNARLQSLRDVLRAGDTLLRRSEQAGPLPLQDVRGVALWCASEERRLEGLEATLLQAAAGSPDERRVVSDALWAGTHPGGIATSFLPGAASPAPWVAAATLARRQLVRIVRTRQRASELAATWAGGE